MRKREKADEKRSRLKDALVGAISEDDAALLGDKLKELALAGNPAAMRLMLQMIDRADRPVITDGPMHEADGKRAEDEERRASRHRGLARLLSGGPMARHALALAGESAPAVVAALEDSPAWFRESAGTVRLTESGRSRLLAPRIEEERE